VPHPPPEPQSGSTAVESASHVRMTAEDRRRQLIEVAIDLFSRKGFNGTTTKEIAAAAGVTEAIIFRHFETKQHLYTAIIDDKLQCAAGSEWFLEMKACMSRNDDEGLFRGLAKAIIGTHRTDPRFERLMLYAALEGNDIALIYMRQIVASIVEAFREYISRRQREGALRDLQPDAVIMAIAGMAKNYAMGKYLHGFKEPCMTDEQAVDAFARITMDGLRTSPIAKKRTAGEKR
jgi:TetR/AcrR family transcriptional regulator